MSRKQKKYDAMATVSDYLKWIHKGEDDCWYRGLPSAQEYKLIPSLYREEYFKSEVKLKSLLDYESSICAGVESELTFERGVALSEWEVYLEARHYGAPSRLLDFTENAFIALYFAVEPNSKVDRHDAAIYRFDPYAWNDLALPKDIRHDRAAVHMPDLKNGNFLNAWGYMNELRSGKFSFKGEEVAISPDLPIAISPPYMNRRMKMQQSKFMLFGKDTKSADQMLPGRGIFEMFSIPSACKREILSFLGKVGFTRGIVYQSLDDIVKDLKRS